MIKEAVVEARDIEPRAMYLFEDATARQVIGITCRNGRIRLALSGSEPRTFGPTDLVTVWVKK